jgi:hypothetical protein
MHRASVRFLLAAITVILLVGLTAPMASADTILTYTGNPFTSCKGDYSPCTGSVSITIDLGALTLANNTANQTFSSVTGVTSYDGFQTICDAGGAITCAGGDETTTFTNDTFNFTTNALGAITAWNVQIWADPLSAGSLIWTTTNTVDGFNGVDVGNYDPFINPCTGDNNCAYVSHPGSWSVSNVPEPSTLGLLGAGLVLFGLWARKRNVTAAPKAC